MVLITKTVSTCEVDLLRQDLVNYISFKVTHVDWSIGLSPLFDVTLSSQSSVEKGVMSGSLLAACYGFDIGFQSDLLGPLSTT